jgi:hypothetical protein
MRKRARDDERDGLEPTMRMRPERQAVVVRRIRLRAMVVEEEEGIDLLEPRIRQRTPRAQIADVVGYGAMLRADAA